MSATPSSAADVLFEELRTGGEPVLSRWKDEQRGEGVHLECKLPSSNQQPGMARADVVQMAAVVSAFANSEGGVLIFGVDAREAHGRDCIQRLVPITDIAAFHRSAEKVRADLVAPAHEGVEMISIPSATSDGSGYLAVRVDQSERRPHRSMKEQIYYRRSHDRTFPMEHSDLKDAMSRTQGPVLAIAADLVDILPNNHQPAESASSFTLLVAITIRNVGGAMARYPFLHFETSPGGGLYDPVSDRRKAPAWSRLLSEVREHRLQGGADQVIPVGTEVRATFAYWTYKRDTATVDGTPLGAFVLGLGGIFGCDGTRTQKFEITMQPHEIIGALHKRGIPITARPTWPAA